MHVKFTLRGCAVGALVTHIGKFFIMYSFDVVLEEISI